MIEHPGHCDDVSVYDAGELGAVLVLGEDVAHIHLSPADVGDLVAVLTACAAYRSETVRVAARTASETRQRPRRQRRRPHRGG